jgi:hypothetical protein
LKLKGDGENTENLVCKIRTCARTMNLNSINISRHPENAIRTPEKVTKSSGALKKEDIEKWFQKVFNNLTKNKHLDILADPTLL